MSNTTELNFFIERGEGETKQFSHLKPTITSTDPREILAQLDVFMAAIEEAGWVTRDPSARNGQFQRTGGGNGSFGNRNNYGVPKIPAFCPNCSSVVRVFAFPANDGNGTLMGWHCSLDKRHTNSKGEDKAQYGNSRLYNQFLAQLQGVYDEQKASGIEPKIQVKDWTPGAPAQPQANAPIAFAPKVAQAPAATQQPAQAQAQPSGSIIGQEVHCPDAGCAAMATIRSGTSQKTGKQWFGVFCNVHNGPEDKTHKLFVNSADELLALYKRLANRAASVPSQEEVWG